MALDERSVFLTKFVLPFKFCFLSDFFPHIFPIVESWAGIYQPLCFCHSQMGHIPSTQRMYQHFPVVALLPNRFWFRRSSTLPKVTYSDLFDIAINCAAQNYLFPRCNGVPVPQYLRLCHERHVLLGLRHENLLQSSVIAAATQEHLAVHEWKKYQEHNPCPLRKKRSPSSPGTVSVLHSDYSTHYSFPPETVFLSKLYPIQQNICTSNHMPDYSTSRSSAVAVSVFQRILIPRGSEQHAASVISQVYSTNFQ